MATFRSVRSASWLLLMTAVSGCTATATVDGGGVPSTCSSDQTVSGCVGNSLGYSCTGSDSPDFNNSALICSDATLSGSESLYCCTDTSAVASDGCSADTSIVGCVGASFGYTCTGSQSPDQVDTSIVCSTGTPVNGATAYCCASYVASSGTCAADATIATCPSPSFGFSCSGSDTPAQVNTALTCGAGVPGGAGTAYCCTSGTTMSMTTPTTGCAADGTVTCTTPATGYTCTGGTTPPQSDATLSCGTSVPGTASGSLSYCCQTGTTSTTGCAADTTVTCTAGSTGYTCTGGTTPPQSDATLVCGTSVPGATSGSLAYCCAPNAGTGCMADATVTGCVSGSSGYSCTGGATPETATLLCGMAMAEPNGTNAYCCASTN